MQSIGKYITAYFNQKNAMKECYSLKKMVFKANAFYEEKKFSLLIKIIVCQGAMTFMNLFVGTQLQYKKKIMEIKEKSTNHSIKCFARCIKN